MENPCDFSPDRRHRYTLLHRINPLFGNKLIMWIGLNPSTADEQKLDPTLTRIRGFSEREGFDGFLMTNIFGFRATDPKEMIRTPDPVGPENDAALLKAAKRCDQVVVAWGAHGIHQDRALAVAKLLGKHKLWCLGTTKDGYPRHPLYVKGGQPLVLWNA